MFSRVGLRHMDFLNIPVRSRQTDATAHYSPSGLEMGFPGHPCPEIAGCLRNIKKLSYDCAGHLHEHFVQFPIFNLFKHLLTPRSYNKKQERNHAAMKAGDFPPIKMFLFKSN